MTDITPASCRIGQTDLRVKVSTIKIDLTAVIMDNFAGLGIWSDLDLER